uniref:Uncharacterized protein n=1 Tax=Alexandrium catenella TaxID=2925 RepID=A0A7S1WXH6_ALECA
MALALQKSTDPRDAQDAWRKPVPGYAGHKTFSWSRLDSTCEGPHVRLGNKTFDTPHLQNYNGHNPRWRSSSAPLQNTGRGVFENTPLPEPSYSRGVHGMPGYAGHRPLNWNPHHMRKSLDSALV